MQTTASGTRKSATPGGRPGAANGTCAKAAGEADPCTLIMTQAPGKVKLGGQVAVILRPGQAPELQVIAESESQQAALAPVLGLARRLAMIAGECAT